MVRRHTKGVYYALFLGSKKLPLSKDIVKDEAIVDAPWVRLCISGSFLTEVGWNCCIFMLHGGVPTIARSTISGCGRPLRAE